MDRERAKELLPIIQAFAEGRAIEWRGGQSYGHWLPVDCFDNISDDKDFEYRIKPEPPKPREWWINDYGQSLAIPVESRGLADNYAGPDRVRCIHVREVLDDEEEEEEGE
jgi:hypothetical protein